MSLSIIAQPEQFILAGNPAELRFSTDNLYSALGAQHKFRLTVTAVPAPGKQFIFSWEDVYFTLTTSINPNDTGYQIGVPTAVPVLSDWVNDDLVPALESNYYIHRDFTVAAQSNLGGTYTVELTARAKGTAYNITFATDAAAMLSGATQIQGADQSIRPNFQTHLELYISTLPLSDYTRIVASQSHTDVESRFRLEGILRTDYYGSALPDYGGLSVKNISQAIIKYYAAYAEAYGSPIAVQKLTETSLYYALQGSWGKDYHAQNSFLTGLNTGKTLLCEASAYRLAMAQPHYLNYLHWQALTHFKVYASLMYTDETSEEVTLYHQVSGATKPSLWCIPAGYNAVAAVKDPAKTVYSYEVWVGASLSSATQYSQKVLHVVDARPQLQQTNFLYKNGFGVYEVFRCTGTVIEQSRVEMQIAQRSLAADYAVTDAQSVTLGQQEQRSWQVNTGYKSKEEMQRFVALLLSPSVYRLDGFFRPVTVVPSEVTLAESRSGRLNEATFTVLADAPLMQGSYV